MPAGGDEVYNDFAATFGRRHSSPEEYEHRRGVFHDNRQFIEDWNAQAPNSDSHILGLNHFADWTQVDSSCLPLFVLWVTCTIHANVPAWQVALQPGQIEQ